MQAAGLSHADSLLQPFPRGNCLNWVIGHIAVHREKMLAALGEETVLPSGTLDRYESESAPILEDGAGVWRLEALFTLLASQQERLSSILETVTTEHLAQPSAQTGSPSVGDTIANLSWHETYHCGATELLRQLAGTDDMLI